MSPRTSKYEPGGPGAIDEWYSYGYKLFAKFHNKTRDYRVKRTRIYFHNKRGGFLLEKEYLQVFMVCFQGRIVC